jgi:hypothetical protein
MIRLPRSASLLVTLCLLTSAATAYAECAWVLWMGSTVHRPTLREQIWTPVGAMSAQNECEQGRDTKVADFVRPSEVMKTKMLGPHTVHEESEAANIVIHRTFLCLPDTVDPRGPKGK